MKTTIPSHCEHQYLIALQYTAVLSAHHLWGITSSVASSTEVPQSLIRYFYLHITKHEAGAYKVIHQCSSAQPDQAPSHTGLFQKLIHGLGIIFLVIMLAMIQRRYTFLAGDISAFEIVFSAKNSTSRISPSQLLQFRHMHWASNRAVQRHTFSTIEFKSIQSVPLTKLEAMLNHPFQHCQHIKLNRLTSSTLDVGSGHSCPSPANAKISFGGKHDTQTGQAGLLSRQFPCYWTQSSILARSSPETAFPLPRAWLGQAS